MLIIICCLSEIQVYLGVLHFIWHLLAGPYLKLMLTPDCECISPPARDWPWSIDFPLQLERHCQVAQERRCFGSHPPGWTVVHAGVSRLNSVWKAILADGWWPSPVRRDEREAPIIWAGPGHLPGDMRHGPPYLQVPYLWIQPIADWKYLGKKICHFSESSKKQNLTSLHADNHLHCIYNYLHCIYVASSIISNL